MQSLALPLTERELVRQGTPDSFGATFDRHAPALREWPGGSG